MIKNPDEEKPRFVNNFSHSQTQATLPYRPVTKRCHSDDKTRQNPSLPA